MCASLARQVACELRPGLIGWALLDLGMAAKQQGVLRFVELSTAQVYDSKDKASAESADLKPWTKQVRAQ